MTPRLRSRRTVGVLLALAVAVLTGCSTGGTSGFSGAPAGPDGTVWRLATGGDVLGSFKSTPWNTDDAEDPVAVRSPDVPGRTAVAFTVPGGGTRSELEPATRGFREGDRAFFGLAIYLPEGFPTSTSDWQVVAQWKNTGDGSPPVSVKVQKGRFVLDGGAGINKMYQRDIGPAVAGTRSDLVLGITFSSDPDTASVDVWQDGKPVVSGYHPRSGTLYSGDSSYLKVGLYRSSDISTEGTVYLDDATVASTREAAAGLVARA